MESQQSFTIQQNFRQFAGINDLNYIPFPNNQFNQIYNNQKTNINSTKASNDRSTADADSFSYQNNNYNYEKLKNSENRIILKKSNEFVNELFKAFGEKNSLCNFSLLEKNIDINMNVDKDTIKKITLQEYFECFNEASFLCLNIPYLDKKGNVSYNVFNPTLSSMNLILKEDKIKEENINKKYLKNNFTLNFISNDLIKIQFDETNQPYNRDIIEAKINILHKILGQKKITLDNIVKDNSYFSILWTPADTYKIKSSFLSFYSFDFKLVGTVILRIDDYNWFTIFCNDMNNYKDFKKEYLNKVNAVESFLKKCNSINDDDNLELNLISYDYKKFRNNY
jgi:hypothetical protein